MIYNDSKVETYNFAVNGATVDRSLINRGSAFSTQVGEKFLPNYDGLGNRTVGGEHEAASTRRERRSDSGDRSGPLAIWEPETTLFSVWFGINDNVFSNRSEVLYDRVFDSYGRLLDQVRLAHSLSLPPFRLDAPLVCQQQSLISSLPQLYTAGARNFLLLNVPPLHRGPHHSKSSSLANSISSWNGRLANLATNFGSVYARTSVFLFDTYDLFNKILDAPADFEQTRHLGNLEDQCDKYVGTLAGQDMYEKECGLPYDQYFWRDGLHVTFPVHQVLGEGVAGLLRGA